MVDYTTYTRAGLAGACRDLGLPTSGSKDTLLARLLQVSAPDPVAVSAADVPAPSRAGVLAVQVDEVGSLDDQRYAARLAAIVAGCTPIGGAYSARYVAPGRFEVPVR